MEENLERGKFRWVLNVSAGKRELLFEVARIHELLENEDGVKFVAIRLAIIYFPIYDEPSP